MPLLRWTALMEMHKEQTQIGKEQNRQGQRATTHLQLAWKKAPEKGIWMQILQQKQSGPVVILFSVGLI